MKAVVDRIVQYANRYKLTNVETGEVLGTFDFDEVTGTVQQVGTEIDKELFDSIANDLAARVKLSGGELAGTIVTFSDISGTAANVASGDTSATLWGKVKNWFSRLKTLAFKNKVAAGDFEAGAIKNADVAEDAAIAQSKVSGLMTDYVASISVSGRTVTYKNKNGVNMGSIITQDTTYGLASPSSNGLMSSTDKTKLDGIESGAQKNTVLGVKGNSESAYRTGNVNITKENIGLGNVDNTSDADKPVSTATQTALNGKANTSGTYPNLTVGKATNADKATSATNATNAANATKATQDANGNVIDETYATKTELVEATGTKVKVNGTTQPEVNFTSDPQTQINDKQTQINDKQTQIDNIESGATKVGFAAQADKLSTARNLKVDLASGTAQSFNGTANAEDIGVDGVLPVANGGTGTNNLDNVFIRTNGVQYLSNIQKNYAKYNVAVAVDGGRTTTGTIGWYNVAKFNYGNTTRSILMTITQTHYAQGYQNIKLLINTSDADNFVITQLSGTRGLVITAQLDKVRIRIVDSVVYIDIHQQSAAFNRNTIYFEDLQSEEVRGNSTYFLQTVDFELVSSDTGVIKELSLVAGFATTGDIYANGSPVLVGYASSVSGTSGSVKLPSVGWYCINYKATILDQSYSTAVFYWIGENTYLPVSAYLLNSGVTTTKRAVNILSDGTVTVFDPDSGTNYTNFTVKCYKLA